MARLPNVTREQVKAEDQGYFDEIVGSRGSIRGPYGVLLHSPKMAARIADTGTYVRFECDLPSNLREVVVITAAREIESQYAFTAHVLLAREAGVSEDTIQAIAQGKAPQGLAGDEELVVRYTLELTRNHKISDATFNAVKDRLGVQGTVDLTGLIGHYLLVGQILLAFEVDLAPGIKPELPV
jgi:4-carboxymuconolactone decarboxylase